MGYVDPPGMPEDERMTAAEFRVVREYLGLTGDWLAMHLDVSPRTVRHWEAGRYRIPDGVRLAMEDLEAEAARIIGQVVAKLLDLPDPQMVVYRTDDEYHRVQPGTEFPAAWFRMIAARVALEVPGLRFDYPAEQATGA